MVAEINYEAITLQDCEDMLNFHDKFTVINDGKVIGFEKNECGKEENIDRAD